MTIIKCDICNSIISKAIVVSVLDGEHPHDHQKLYKQIDCCQYCIGRIDDLQTEYTLEELKGL